MAIDFSASYPAAPDAVLDLLTDEAFLRDRASALGARLEELTVAGTVTTVRFAAPTAGIPPVFARFVGSSVSVVERTTWVPDGRGHRAVLDVRAEIVGRTVRVDGERRLEPAGAGTRSTVAGDAKVNAPLIGRQAEGSVRELVGVMLRREDELITARLGCGPSVAAATMRAWSPSSSRGPATTSRRSGSTTRSPSSPGASRRRPAGGCTRSPSATTGRSGPPRSARSCRGAATQQLRRGELIERTEQLSSASLVLAVYPGRRHRGHRRPADHRRRVGVGQPVHRAARTRCALRRA